MAPIGCLATALVLTLTCCGLGVSPVEFDENPTNSLADGLLTYGPPQPRSQEGFVEKLTSPERYDKHERPLHGIAPVNVTARAYIYIMQFIEGGQRPQLKLTLKLQLGFQDPRLQFSGTQALVGGTELLQRLWTPHIFMANERHSLHMGSGKSKDVLVRVFPDGHVLFASRLTLTVVCVIKYGKFPFDQQECPLVIESWLDDADNLVLRWADDSKAVTHSQDVSLSSFTLRDMQKEENLLERSKYIEPDEDRFGNSFWSITLNLSLSRVQGFFIMDYYLPSVLLVVISWVTFWLDPDMVPARVLLGSSTMLTFITLAVKTDRSLPASYSKASEIWFVGCCTFIFGSLVEFAFVNTIWRKGESVELKKVNTRHILKSTLGTPRGPRTPNLLDPEQQQQGRFVRRRTSSMPDVDAFLSHRLGSAHPLDYKFPESDAGYYHTIHSGALSRPPTLPSVSESVETTSMENLNNIDDQTPFPDSAPRPPHLLSVTAPRPGRGSPGDGHPDLDTAPTIPMGRRMSLSAGINAGFRGCRRLAISFTPGFTRMSAKEVSDWIDRRSRVFFPVSFLIFNCLYWAFVWFF